MYQTLQTVIPPQLWRRVRRTPTDFTYLQYSEQQRHKAQFSAITFRSNHCRKETNTASVPQCICIIPIYCVFSAVTTRGLWRRADASKQAASAKSGSALVHTVYFATSHDVRIVIQTWFVCLKLLSSGAFTGIFVSNSASKPVDKGLWRYTVTVSVDWATQVKLRIGYIHEYTACLYRQIGTAGCVSALANCRFIDLHILLRCHITGNRSTYEQRPS